MRCVIINGNLKYSYDFKYVVGKKSLINYSSLFYTNNKENVAQMGDKLIFDKKIKYGLLPNLF